MPGSAASVPADHCCRPLRRIRPERFVVPGNAAATASNITDNAFMFRLGIAADLFTFVCAVALTIGELSFAVWLTVKGVNVA